MLCVRYYYTTLGGGKPVGEGEAKEIPMVCANPVGSDGNALGGRAGSIARSGRAALGPDRLQPDALRLCL